MYVLGDIMMIIDGDLPRNQLLEARGTELPPYSDRHARLEIGSSMLCRDGKRSQDLFFERPIHMLILLADNDI